MNLEEFAVRLKTLDEHIAGALKWFEDDTGVTVGSLSAELDESGAAYIVTTGLDFPEGEAQ
jgi:hypothetical protein